MAAHAPVRDVVGSTDRYYNEGALVAGCQDYSYLPETVRTHDRLTDRFRNRRARRPNSLGHRAA